MLNPPDSVFFDFLFSIYIIVSILYVGIGTFCALTKDISFTTIEIVCFGVVTGFVVHALIGMVVGCLPFHNQICAAILLGSCYAFSTLYWKRAKFWAKTSSQDKVSATCGILGWFFLAAISITISHVAISFPEKLNDGPYVIKNHNLHVKIQAITGNLPADNYLPYLVSEFFLRNISFKDERPLMPGQEIANRPILMALITIPFRALVDPPPISKGPLPKFEYVGSSWPDVGTIGEDRYFRQFLVVGVVLNSVIVLASALIFQSYGLGKLSFFSGLILLVLNPYFISQTLFTWPKCLSAFFLLTALHVLKERRSVAWAGFLSALAYWSHPYAIVFAFIFTLYLTLTPKKIAIWWRDPAVFGMTFIATVMPWFIWTKYVLNISSDLVSQNLLTNETYINLLWVRIHNLYETILPSFFAIFPFVGEQVISSMLVSIPGIVGLIFFIPIYLSLKHNFSNYRLPVWFFILIPGALLIGVFSAPAVPALHGFQAIGPVLMLFGLKLLEEKGFKKTLIVMVAVQISINLLVVGVRANTLDVRAGELFTVRKASLNLLTLTTKSNFLIADAKLPPNLGVNVKIGGKELSTFWSTPPTKFVFKRLLLGSSPIFSSALAIHPAVWAEGGADGAIFRVTVLINNIEAAHFDKPVNPFANPDDRKWQDFIIDLSRFKNQSVDLALSVQVGPSGNDYADWCLWGEPALKDAIVRN